MKVEAFVLCGLLRSAAAGAAAEPPPKAGSEIPAAVEPAEAGVTMEPIECPGTRETDDGRWNDPEQPEQMDLPQEQNDHED
jgi:hypothetical protein